MKPREDKDSRPIGHSICIQEGVVGVIKESEMEITNEHGNKVVDS